VSEASASPASVPFSDVLQGVRVLDFCWVGAGALVTKLLADLGAEVIKIESRRRPDNLRTSPPFKGDVEGLDGSGYFASRNTSKLSFALDMKHPLARGVALDLARTCDVVANNFRPGVMARFGLSYAEVREQNESTIYLSMPMQGQDGPHRDHIGFGSTILALSGIAAATGLADRAPVGTGTQYPDHVPNPGHALVALLAALLHRDATGSGQEIELSQLESTVNFAGPSVLAESLGMGSPAAMGNRRPDACPSGVFPCAGDDAWCVVEVRTDSQWDRLVDWLGSPDWATQAALRRLDGRKAIEDRIERELATVTRGWDKHELMHALQAHGVPAGIVATSRDVAEDPHLRERGHWHRPPHAVIGPMAVNGAPFRVDGRPLPPRASAPILGAHTRDVATRVLGYSDAEFETLAASGVFS
jgi:benzylsuccinate CoA-transferase BbsF subunit